jgi:hypothetical protein
MWVILNCKPLFTVPLAHEGGYASGSKVNLYHGPLCQAR